MVDERAQVESKEAPSGDVVPEKQPATAQQADSGDVEKLRRETERLRSALAKREEAEAKAKIRAEAADRDAAAKRGEWEKLFGESEAKGKTLSEQLELERVKREGYEKLLSERVEASLKNVEDADLRRTWKSALEGLDPAAQLRTLDALQATAGKVKPTTPKPGAAGRTRKTIDLREFSQNTPMTRRALNEAVLADLKAKGT